MPDQQEPLDLGAARARAERVLSFLRKEGNTQRIRGICELIDILHESFDDEITAIASRRNDNRLRQEESLRQTLAEMKEFNDSIEAHRVKASQIAAGLDRRIEEHEHEIRAATEVSKATGGTIEDTVKYKLLTMSEQQENDSEMMKLYQQCREAEKEKVAAYEEAQSLREEFLLHRETSAFEKDHLESEVKRLRAQAQELQLTLSQQTESSKK